jgi:hypothetical protein
MLLRCLLVGALALLPQPSFAQTQPVVVSVTSGSPTTVWNYSTPGAPCAADDFPDVPARPFLMGSGINANVLWFASNSSGFWASKSSAFSRDILASVTRGLPNGPRCSAWMPPASYGGIAPASYAGGYWMVAPFTPDGINVEALVHQEFHGEWSGNPTWCFEQQGKPSSIYLPCNYWNIVSAHSSNSGQNFQLRQAAAASANVPAIALGQPYQPPPQTPKPVNLPQGITAQSNILAAGNALYVLVQQLPYQAPNTPPPPQSGVCLYRATIPASPGAPLTWFGWDGSGYTVAVPTSYPASPLPLCRRVLGAPFRFSWSYSTVGPPQTVLIIGQDLLSSGISTMGCPYAQGASAETADAAFVYATAQLDAASGVLTTTSAETCLLQINSMANWQANPTRTGHAYPSLLDPASPTLGSGDRNFQFSGPSPFLYFTRLNPGAAGSPNNNRDLVRVPLNVSPATKN